MTGHVLYHTWYVTYGPLLSAGPDALCARRVLCHRREPSSRPGKQFLFVLSLSSVVVVLMLLLLSLLLSLLLLLLMLLLLLIC